MGLTALYKPPSARLLLCLSLPLRRLSHHEVESFGGRLLSTLFSLSAVPRLHIDPLTAWSSPLTEQLHAIGGFWAAAGLAWRNLYSIFILTVGAPILLPDTWAHTRYKKKSDTEEHHLKMVVCFYTLIILLEDVRYTSFKR